MELNRADIVRLQQRHNPTITAIRLLLRSEGKTNHESLSILLATATAILEQMPKAKRADLDHERGRHWADLLAQYGPEAMEACFGRLSLLVQQLNETVLDVTGRREPDIMGEIGFLPTRGGQCRYVDTTQGGSCDAERP